MSQSNALTDPFVGTNVVPISAEVTPVNLGPVARDWYIVIDGVQVGPLSLDEIESRWNQHEARSESFVWKSGMPDWLTIADVPQLTYLITEHPQRPTSVSQTPVAGDIPTTQVHDAAVAWQPSAAQTLNALVEGELASVQTPNAVVQTTPAWNIDALPGFAGVDLFAPLAQPTLQPMSFGASDNWGTTPMAVAPSHGIRPIHLLVGGIGLATLLLLAVVIGVMAARANLETTTRSTAASTSMAPPLQQQTVVKEAAVVKKKQEPIAKSKPVAKATEYKRPQPQHRTLTMEDIWNGVRKHKSTVRPCLVRAQRGRELLAGRYKILLNWKIKPNGRVGQGRVVGPASILNTSIPECFATAMNKWRFPPSQAGAPVRNFPFGPIKIR